VIQLTVLFMGHTLVNPSCIATINAARSTSEKHANSLVRMTGDEYPMECIETVDEVLAKIASQGHA
jgi:hypothetical protein